MSNKVDDYIDKQGSPQKEICQNLRKLILKTFPKAKEEMALFDGGGKTMKHIQVDEIDIDENKIIELLKLVDKKASV